MPQHPTRQQPLSTHELTERVESGDVDTVVVAFTDMQGRLQGKRLHAQLLPRRGASSHGTEGCNYLLAVDVDMNTVDGYAMSSWERGLRRLRASPRTSTRCGRAPWLPGDRDGPVRPGLARRHPGRASRPGRSCAAQLDAAAALGLRRPRPAPSWSSSSSTTPTRRPGTRGYRDLTPANQYNVDYSILGTSRVEPLLRDIRNEMYGAGLTVESRQGRVQPRPARDRASSYAEVAAHRGQPRRSTRPAAKEIAAQHGKSLTFMAKYDEREGNSCHIHLSPARARTARWCSPTTSRRRRAQPALRPASSPGVLATLRELHPALRAEHQLLQAVRSRARSPRPRSPGARTTAPARAAGRARRRRCGWRTGCRAATSTPTSRWPR